jgi:hypothetical protein
LKRIATALVCTLFATVSLADCANPTSVSQEFKESQAVVIGTVESSRPVPQTWDSFDGTDFVVRVDQKVKGKESGEITVFSEHSADGYNLEIGKQYLLFLTFQSPHWIVNHCGNSGALDESGSAIKQIAHLLGND